MSQPLKNERQDINGTLRGRFLFAILTGIILVVWCVLLPAVIQQPDVASHIIDLEVKGIDPSAMFYTDLEIAEEISYRVERGSKKDPDLLWKLKDN